jgi:predicted phage baseplate assembly protein
MRRVFCDTVVKGVGPGLVVLRDGPTWDVYGSNDVRTTSKSVFTVSGRSTVLTLDTGSRKLSAFGIRGTTVHLSPQWVTLAPQPAPAALPGGTAGAVVELDDWAEGLYAGQRVAVTGRLHAVPSTTRNHVTTITAVSHDLTESGTTSIVLQSAPPEALLRESVVINANVALGTHGETRAEVLGNSDGSDPHPTYRLSGRPLTHVTTKDGSRPELRVYVSGVLRHPVPALLTDDEQGYVLREDDTGATIEFGSPLPTGVATVRAVYRTGLGSGARVRAGQLDLLTQRPAGVRSVTNPLPAEGGSDPETADNARRNGPASVRSLDRLVSLLDYEDHARAFPGIAKALGTWTRGAGRRGVLVTVAGDGGSPIPNGGEVQEALVAGLVAKGDPDVPVAVRPCLAVSLRIGATLRLDPDRLAPDVLAAVHAELLTAFGFDARDLGQPVSESEVLVVLHAVPGVVAAHLTELRRVVDGTPEGGTAVQPFLRAASPAAGALRGDATQTAPAELLTLRPEEPAVLKVVP